MQEATIHTVRRQAGLRCWAIYGPNVCPVCSGSGVVASTSWREWARKGGVKSYLSSLRQGSLSMKERGELGGRPRAINIESLKKGGKSRQTRKGLGTCHQVK